MKLPVDPDPAASFRDLVAVARYRA